ncbi:MAG: prepilin-type N-terminal cleavage/methylation domain-containing protein [Candidatus Brocadiae bacterium]|nr:prepilin-type N-terminal cleavage/methylation domain-containing protein [Candidatus Brocadiia bacterium]
MRNNSKAFTLIEILIAMSILIVGLVGVLALFPVGLNATKKAIEDTNAALIADSVYSALRAAAQQTAPNNKLRFFFDGINKDEVAFPAAKNFTEGDLRGNYFGIPRHGGAYTTAPAAIDANYTPDPLTDVCRMARPQGANEPYNIAVDNDQDEGQLRQYSFHVQISYPTANPKSLYDVVIRIYRSNRLIKKFYTQIMIPTGD